jgi:predicted aspartyl protease
LKPEQAIANVKLSYGDKFIELEALVDTGASKSVISKRLAEKLDALILLKEPYELRTAD